MRTPTAVSALVGCCLALSASGLQAQLVNPPRPSLSIQVSTNGQVLLQWPSQFQGYSLEHAGSLAAALWQPVGPAPPAQGGFYTMSVAATNAPGYYRLQQAGFEVTSHNPLDGAVDVGCTFRPQVFFSKPANPATLSSSNFFASFGGQTLAATIVPANDGSFAWLFLSSPMPGGAEIEVTVDGSTILPAGGGAALDAAGNGTPGSVLQFQFATVSLAPLTGTALAGIVVDPGPDLIPNTADDVQINPDGSKTYLLPIAGVKVSLPGLPNQTVTTGTNGQFFFPAVPSGDVKVVFEGPSASSPPPGYYFPEMVIDAQMVLGITNSAMKDTAAVYLPRLATNILQTVSASTTNVVAASSAGAPFLSAFQRSQLTLTIAPNSLIGPSGQPMASGQVGISTVPSQLVMDMLPPGVLQHTFDITVQAPGIATFSTPAPLTFPNVFNAAPGTQLDFLSFDHTTGRLVIEGTATVSADGATVRTDPGTGVTHPGWHGLTPPGNPSVPPCGGDPPPMATAGVTPVPYGDITLDSDSVLIGAKNYLFADDASQLQLYFENEATPLSADRCSATAMSATPLEVDLQYDHKVASQFLTGLPTTPFFLWPGESKKYSVKMKPLADPAQLKKLSGTNLADVLYGISITVNYRQFSRDGTTRAIIPQGLQPFYIYRYLDALDDKPADGKLEFPPALAEGPSKVSRRRPQLIRSSVDVGQAVDDNADFDFDSNALIFQPQTVADTLITRLHVIPPDGREADGSSSTVDRKIFLVGQGAPLQKINVNKQGLVDNLAAIAQADDPSPQEVIIVPKDQVNGLAPNSYFTLNFSGQSTPPLPFAASGADVQAALEALSTVGQNNVVVTREDRPADLSVNGAVSKAAVFTVQFQGAFAGTTLPLLQLWPTGGFIAGPASPVQFRLLLFSRSAPDPTLTFTLNFATTSGSYVAGPFAYSDSANDVLNLLRTKLPFIGPGDVAVASEAGNTSPSTPLYVTGFDFTFTAGVLAVVKSISVTTTDGIVDGPVGAGPGTVTPVYLPNRITPNTRALFNTDALRHALADDVGASIANRYSQFAAGSQNVPAIEDGDPVNAVTFDWEFTGRAEPQIGQTPAIDNQSAIGAVVQQHKDYNSAVQNLLLAKAVNQTPAVTVLLSPVKMLQGVDLLEPTRPQLINKLAEVAAHEAGHSFGLTHTAKYNHSKIVTNSVQTVALSSGGPADSYTLSLSGVPTLTIPASADSSAVATYLDGVGADLALGPPPLYNFNVTGPPGGPFVVSFAGFLGMEVPQLLGVGSGSLSVQTTLLEQGLVQDLYDPKVLASFPNGANDIMDAVSVVRAWTDSTYGFVSGYSVEKLLLALKLDWTAAQARTALGSYVKWFTVGVFDQEVTFDPVDAFPPVSISGPALAVFDDQDELSPRGLDFGSVNLATGGGAEATNTLTLQNHGSDDLALNQVTLTGTSGAFFTAPLPPGTILHPGDILPLQVFFAPTNSGDFQDTLAIDTTDPSGIYEIDLSGAAVRGGPDLRVFFDNNNLGGAPIQGGSVSVANFATITNAGLQPLIISNIVVAAGQDEFSLGGLPAGLGPSQPLVLQPGGSASFSLGFQPNAIGLRRGEVQIFSNDPNTPLYHLHVVGTGLAASGNPLDSLHYGNDYVALETPDLAGSPVLRQKSDANGNWSFFLPPDQRFHAVIFDPISGLVAHIYGITSPSGQPTLMPAFPVFLPSTDFDTDGDGLADDVEFAVGTDPTKVNTTGTGPDDFDKVEEGLDPLAGTTLETGVIAALPLGTGKTTGIALASPPNDSSKLMAHLAVMTTPFSGLTFSGLAIVDVSQFNKPLLVGQLAFPFASSSANAPLAVDPTVQVAALVTPNNLQLVDVSTPAAPALITTVTLNRPGAVDAFDSVAYVGVGKNLEAFDLRSGTALQTLALAGQPIVGLAHDASTLYSMDSAGTLQVIDLSANQMAARGSLVITNAGGPLLVGNGIAYVLMQPAFPTGGGYSTVDVSDPANPTLLRGPDLPAGTRAPSTALAANGSGLGLLIGSFGGPGVLDVMDLSVPTNNYVFVNRFNLPAAPDDVAEASGIAYVADDTAGLQIVNYLAFSGQAQGPTVTVAPAVPSANTNAPGFEVVAGATLPLRVSISDGAQVRTVELLANGQVVAQTGSFPFDLSVLAPNFNPLATNLVVQVRATDTAGNVALSAPLQLQIIRDPVPPFIVSTYPTNGAAVPSDFSTGLILFSKPMAAATLNATNIQILDANGQPVTLSSLQALTTNLHSGKEVSAAALNLGRLDPGTYQFLIQAPAILDGSGNALGLTNLTSSFTVDRYSIRWTNTLGGDWSVPSNWNLGRLPGPNDDVLMFETNLVNGLFGPELPPVFLQWSTAPTNFVTLRSLTSSDEVDLLGLTLNVTETISISNVFYMDAATLGGGTILAGTNTVIVVGVDQNILRACR